MDSPMSAKDRQELDWLFEAMERHGDAEGTETQLGDAESLLRRAYELMTPEQRQLFLRSEEAVALFDDLQL